MNGAEPTLQPTVTWDCATAVVSNENVKKSYEKPTYSKETKFDPITGKPIPGTGQIVSYGRMLTKTVTMTVTTTIARTEILQPGEQGYEESLGRQKAQEKERIVLCSSPVSMNDEDFKNNTHTDSNGNKSWCSNGPAFAELDKAFNASQNDSVEIVLDKSTEEASISTK